MSDQQEQVPESAEQSGTTAMATTSPTAQPPVQPAPRPGCTVLGWVLILIGLLLLGHNLGWIAWIDLSLWWPALLMIIGLTLIVRKLRS